jgi:molybdate transport system regulatory protein
MNPSDRSSRARRRQPVQPCIGTLTLRHKVWIELDGRFAIGEGGAALLRDIELEGSLAQGARRVGWSYRHAWGYIRRAESVLGTPLLSTRSGKGSARGAVLTDAARHIVATLLGDALEAHRSRARKDRQPRTTNSFRPRYQDKAAEDLVRK